MAVQERLEQSHLALREYFSPLKRHENTGNPAQLVVFAEHAVKNGCRDIALDCVELYFSLNPPVNQFFVKAHLCEALAFAPQDHSQEELFSHSLSCIVKAVSAAKKSEWYVSATQICRPFQRPGSRRLYSKPLQTVVKALEEIKDQDALWRVELMIGLVLSQLDGGQSEEATKTCSTALQLAKKRAPEKLGEILRLHVSYNLGDSKVFDRETRSSPEYSTLVRLYKAKCAMTQQKLSGSEFEQRLRKVLTFILNGEEPSSGRRTAGQSRTPAPPIGTRPPLLLELGSLAAENGLVNLAEECLNAAPQELVEHNVQLLIQRQVLDCQVLVREGYSKSAVEGRVQAVRRLDDILISAIRANDMDLIQHVCVAQWNTSMPLLQPNLRRHLLKPLSAIANALEHIDSLLSQMRVGIHFELGKIYSDQGQLEASLEHLEKAMHLDCNEEYREQIGVVQNKVMLRAQLYTTPKEPLQRAIKIIEQAGSVSEGSEELRSLLVKAGELLAPEVFSQTLTSPSSTGPVSQTSDPEVSHETRVIVEDKGRKMIDYNLAREMVRKHLNSIDKQEDTQRCRVWCDLARTARKQSIWDVATSAALFCVAYDDGRWAGTVTKSESTISERLSSPRLSQHGSQTVPRRISSAFLQKSDSQLVVAKSQSGASVSSGGVGGVRREECDLVRTLANIHCLLAECLVFYLQQEGLQLGQQPPSLNLTPPLDKQWALYTTWVSQLTADSVASFLRGAELGVMLGEVVIVACAAAYLWNYHHHWVKGGRLTEVVGMFKPLLASMRLVDISGDAVLLTRLCSALVGGIVQKWTPKPVPASDRVATAQDKKGRAESRTTKKVKGGDDQLQVDPESGPELKEAIEVCDYCFGLWSSVPLSVRGGLLTVWVACRQLLCQPFTNKTFDIEETGDSSAAQCRVMVAMSLVSTQGNGIWEFPNCPTLNEVSSMISECEWEEVIVEMELWVQLAELALKYKDSSLAYQCTTKAVSLNFPGTASEKLSSDDRVGYELLSLAHSVQGQALSISSAGNVVIVRKALEAFLNCARCGQKASSYSLVFEGCRHYWLTCQPLTFESLERALLQEPLCELLELCVPLLGGRHGGKGEDPALASSRKTEYELVTHLYSTVFQACIDKACWDEGLALVEDALWNTPKPIHTHLVTYKLVFKSRMGKSVEGDLIRFQEEPSVFVASLWHKAAVNASDPALTIQAYQNAIDILESESSWQKIKYLLEFSEWLYAHDFPTSDPINQLEKIAEILMSIPENEPENLDGGHVLRGVRQLEVLMRVHVMMALLHGRGSTEHAQMSTVAVGYCLELWKVLVGSTNVPVTTVMWSTYSPSNEVIVQLKESGGHRGLNQDNVARPMLTLHYLTELTESLTFCGLHPLTLPVLKLQLVVAETLLEQSTSLCQLYNMRLSSLCSDLGLPSSSSPLPSLPDPEDLAASQVEIEKYQAKKAAVEKEGSKRSVSGKPSLSKSIKRKSTATFIEGGKGSESKSSSAVSSSGQFCVQEKMVLREVWVNMAQLLIQQGEYLVARDLLNHAMLSSQVFNDRNTLFRIHILLARLTLIEGNQQKAIKLLTNAQTYPASLSDWLEGMLLLSNAISTSSDYRSQLKPVLEHAVTKLGKVQNLEQNASNRLEYVVATIKARLAICELSDKVKEISKTVASVGAFNDSLTDSTKTLMTLGYHREAAGISMQHASFLRTLALLELDRNEEQFKAWLLEAISLCDKTVTALQSLCEHAVLICQPSEEVSLPVQKELVEAQCLLAELLMDAFSHHSLQSRRTRDEMREKSSVEKLIEDFVREEPALSLIQKEWENNIKMGLERALALLTSAHSTAHGDGTLKTKILANLGHCLHLLSTHTRPDPTLQWNNEYCVMKTSGDNVEPAVNEGESPKTEGNPPATLSGAKYGALSSVMRINEAEKDENDETRSVLYLTQACHTLVHAVSTAISNNQLVLGMQAALELVNCCGGFDSTTASVYLALYQSLSVSVEMDELLRRVMADPSSSKLGALLEQNKHLSMCTSQSPSIQHNIDELQRFEAYKMKSVSDNHLDLLKQFPSHFRLLVLQHSPDRCRLYASYLVPPQPPPPAPKKGQPPPTVECLDPVISCATVSRADLDSLLKMMCDFQVNNYQGLVKPTLQHNDSGSLLKDVLAATEAYLSPVMTKIVEAFRREKSDRELSVVVLADSPLLQLPLEAMDVFRANNIHSVSRDFSIQLLCHRLETFSDDSIPPVESSKDTKKKGDKYQPQPITLLANAANFKYVLDPRKELEGNERSSEIISQIQNFSKLTSKWSGYNAGEQVMSVSDWTSLLKEASGLIAFTTESFLAHLPVSNLTPLSLNDASVAVIMDRMHTTQSVLQQSKLDFHKSEFQLECERPVVTAMFLSMVGVRCLLSNQWSTTSQCNLNNTTSALKGLLSEGSTVGELNWKRVQGFFQSSPAVSEQEAAQDVPGTDSGIKQQDNDMESVLIQELSTEDTPTKLIDYSAAFNCVLYGLPHINLIAPST